jgi:hypothetical protein
VTISVGETNVEEEALKAAINEPNMAASNMRIEVKQPPEGSDIMPHT